MTKKELSDIWQRKIVYKNVSDVIIRNRNTGPYGWRNLMTGKVSSESVASLARGKYIYSPAPGSLKFYEGYYVEEVPEYDAALIIIMRLNLNADKAFWKEHMRILATADGRIYRNKNIKNWSLHTDITGKYVEYMDENISLDGKRKLRKILKGCSSYSPQNNMTLYSTFDDVERIVSGKANIGTKVFFKENECSVSEKLPEELIRRAKRRLRSKFTGNDDQILRRSRFFTELMTNGTSFAYLEKTDTGCCYRVFYLQMDFDSEEDVIKRKKYYMFEAFRVFLTADLLKDIHTLNCYPLAEPLLYYDKEIEGLKYQYPIFSKLNTFLKHCMARKQAGFESKTNPYSMKMAMLFTSVPLMERLYKSKYDRLANFLISNTIYRNGDMRKNIESLIGPIGWNKKTIHQCIGVPEYALDIWKENPRRTNIGVECIRVAKELFGSCPSYLLSMNAEDCETLMIKFLDNMVFGSFSEHTFKTIQRLIEIYGPENWKEYFSYLRDIPHDYHLSLSDYEEYIEMAWKIRDNVDMKSQQWKFKDIDEMNRSKNAIAPAYYMYLDEEEHREKTEKFKELHEKWEKYEDDTDSKFVVIAPKVPSDVIIEGIKLNHCAKTFVDKISKDDTMVLFVRRKDHTNKPFFTLEIRDDVIRQCHGANNRNIDSVSDLEDFLINYCNRKHVQWGYCSSLLPA